MLVRSLLPILPLGLFAATLAAQPQQQATVVATKDNTLYEDPNGALSNGAGTRVFSGNTAGLEKRRALVAFDLTGQVPPGSTVASVSLSMTVVKTVTGDVPTALHRVLAD